ncbi:MAG: hypothetical protein POELPBGB_03093 [Bacteroidia bacterium]|nr:hypothetical protein [Bacteroidia bacterium]
MNQAKTVVVFFMLTSLCLFTLTVSAQKLYFCKSYSETGEPKGVSEDWSFDGKPTEVTFLYNNGKTTFSFASLFFVIENTATKKTNKVEFKVAQNRNWDAMKYTFKEAGYYAVSVFGNDNKLLAKSLIKVGETKAREVVKEEVKNEAVSKEVKNVEENKTEPKEVVAELKVEQQEESKEVKEVLYYDELKVVFCEQVKENKVVNEKTNFKMSELGAYVEVVLQNTKALNTSAITVDIWKKDGDSYSEHVDEQELKLDSKSKQVNFHRSFFKPGDYKFSFFNDNGVWMTTGYVTVTQ